MSENEGRQQILETHRQTRRAAGELQRELYRQWWATPEGRGRMKELRDKYRSRKARVKGRKNPRGTKIANAFYLLRQHPELTNKGIARRVGCHVKTLSNHKDFKAIRKLLKEQARKNLPRGSKTKEGDMEAWDHEER